MSKRASLASCIAKMYDGSNSDNSGAASGAVRKPCIIPGTGIVSTLGSMEVKLIQLESHVEQIASGHADVLHRLDMVCNGLGSLEKGLAQIQRSWGRQADFWAVDNQRGLSTSVEEVVPTVSSEVRGLCWENMKLLKNLTREGKSQRERLAGIEESVSTVDTMLEYIAEVFQSSKVVEFILKGDVPWRIKSLLGSTVSNRHQVSPFWLSVHLYFKNIGRSWEVKKDPPPPPQGSLCQETPRSLLCGSEYNSKVETDVENNAIVQIEEALREPGSVHQTTKLTGLNKEECTL
ncbi:unnamed protein product [Merluccius merluccius]